MACGWDIKVVSHDENLINIQEVVGYYDILQYPLLWYISFYNIDCISTQNYNDQNISCREYYNYML